MVRGDRLLTRWFPILAFAAATVLDVRSVQSQAPIPFVTIARAQTSLVARINQTRSALEPDGHGGARWASLEESLGLGGKDDSGNLRFRLTLEGVPGMQLDPSQLDLRRQLHASHAGYLQQFGGFRIDDPVLAERNHLLVRLDDRVRLGRATHRLALLPRCFGRAAWIIELDAATLHPLFAAQVSAFGIIVETLEVTRFEPVAESALGNVDWWQPTMQISRFPSHATAAASIQHASVAVPEFTGIPTGYEFREARVVHDDLRPETSLVLVFGDGIDSMFVMETYGAPPPPLPWPSNTDPTAPYAIFSYRDQHVAQHMFYVNGVRTLVIGDSNHLELGPLAESLLTSALNVR